MKTCVLKILAAGLVLCAAVANLSAQVTLTTLHTFGAGSIDGQYPYASLVQGSDGLFYGTTLKGGTNTASPSGTVFQINTNGGSYAVLHSFPESITQDGSLSTPGLVEDHTNPGNFFGLTDAGGTNGGYGTVFRIKPDGTYTVLHTFAGNPDGAIKNVYSYAGQLLQGKDGNFYGTTPLGGTNTAGLQGTVFQINSTGDVTILHSFTGAYDGNQPMGGLVQASDGNFYGTTYANGTNSAGSAYGTVFRLNITNGVLTTLHTFVGGSFDGAEPEGALVQGLDGNLYGTTSGGGTHSAGVVFRISSGGSYTNLHPFGEFTYDGGKPVAGLVLGSDGNFYGTTQLGGTSTNGTVFRISPTGSYSNLYSFTGGSDGKQPYAGLVQGSDGSFYGTTETGGTNGIGYGTVFKLTVPLNPPANQISAIQVAGTNVLVTIPSVATEMYQLQYRTSLTAGAWSNINAAAVTSIGGPLTVTNFGGFSQSQQFYRFAITP